jgi:hypothetical protein
VPGNILFSPLQSETRQQAGAENHALAAGSACFASLSLVSLLLVLSLFDEVSFFPFFAFFLAPSFRQKLDDGNGGAVPFPGLLFDDPHISALPIQEAIFLLVKEPVCHILSCKTARA